MKFEQVLTADLVPGDAVWREGERLVFEKRELVQATEHGSSYWIINGRVAVNTAHKWTVER